MRTDNTLTWTASDHHGTAQVAINAVSMTTSVRRMDPFGTARGEQPAEWPSEKGFVGGTVDAAVGLTHLGAREYDAELGRFISVDPLIDHSDMQQMNGYAYSNNNPTSASDSDGMFFGWFAAVQNLMNAINEAFGSGSSGQPPRGGSGGRGSSRDDQPPLPVPIVSGQPQIPLPEGFSEAQLSLMSLLFRDISSVDRRLVGEGIWIEEFDTLVATESEMSLTMTRTVTGEVELTNSSGTTWEGSGSLSLGPLTVGGKYGQITEKTEVQRDGYSVETGEKVTIKNGAPQKTSMYRSGASTISIYMT